MNEERIIEWFEYIAQLATDRKTPYGFVMEDSDVLDEIKVKAEQCAQCIKNMAWIARMILLYKIAKSWVTLKQRSGC